MRASSHYHDLQFMTEFPDLHSTKLLSRIHAFQTWKPLSFAAGRLSQTEDHTRASSHVPASSS